MAEPFDPILDFWFPPDLDDNDRPAIGAFFQARMQGGMDAAIIRDHAQITEAAARGELDHWAESWQGRLALILLLDQFPRSLWRDTPGAFAQDIKSTRLALEGLTNGHYQATPHMHQRAFYLICISHCEGPDHLARMDMLVNMVEAEVETETRPAVLESLEGFHRQLCTVRGVVQRFGRHPHRNAILGRLSTPEEEAYIQQGDFPHKPKPDA